MKTICTNYPNRKGLRILQVRRDNIIRNYNPTQASWKRFIILSMMDSYRKPYKTFRIPTPAAFIGECEIVADDEQIWKKLRHDGEYDLTQKQIVQKRKHITKVINPQTNGTIRYTGRVYHPAKKQKQKEK